MFIKNNKLYLYKKGLIMEIEVIENMINEYDEKLNTIRRTL